MLVQFAVRSATNSLLAEWRITILRRRSFLSFVKHDVFSAYLCPPLRRIPERGMDPRVGVHLPTDICKCSGLFVHVRNCRRNWLSGRPMQIVQLSVAEVCSRPQGRKTQPRLKSWWRPRFESQHRRAWAQRPAKVRAGCWVREGSLPSASKDPGYYPQKIFENSDAKSCILVTTTLISELPRTWNFLLFENYGQEIGGPIHCWSLTLKLGTSLPRSLRLLRLYPTPVCSWILLQLRLWPNHLPPTISGSFLPQTGLWV